MEIMPSLPRLNKIYMTTIQIIFLNSEALIWPLKTVSFTTVYARDCVVTLPLWLGIYKTIHSVALTMVKIEHKLASICRNAIALMAKNNYKLLCGGKIRTMTKL